MTNDADAGEQPLVTGHLAGAQGVVVRAAVKGQAKVLVRFDGTGHQISVPPEALKPLASVAAPPERIVEIGRCN